MTDGHSPDTWALGARGKSPHGIRRLRAAACLLAAAVAPAPTAGQDRPLAADLVEVYRVGGLNAPQWAFFEGREPTGFDAAGNLYVLDAQAGQVVVIDPRGELVRTMGRKGEGPGEFDGAGRLFVWRDGRFAVVDMGQAAYQVFGPDGELERYVRMGGDAGRLAFLRGMRLETRADPAGGALIAQGMPSELGAMSGALEALAELTGETLELPEAAVDESGLERLDLTGEVVSATPILRAWKAPREEVPGITSIEDLRDPSKLWGVTNRIRYFEPHLLWDVLPDGTIAYADSTAYAVKLAAPGGRVIDVLRRPFAPEAVTDRIRKEVIDRELRRHDEREESQGVAGAPEFLSGYFSDMDKARRAAIEEREFYPEIQIVRAVRATWDGALWIQRRGDRPWDNTGPIDVFGANREYVGTFAEEDLAMPAAFGPGGLVVYWEFDELDVPTIVVRRIAEVVR
ncbi:MAG: hypothetical protein OXQ94_01500 [Gemmatimonadota bacterium]|nr:hypothetical protein [Gemmatimonadota bacterium]MDE2870354.1 hypothetical protein [Gemmatimonadota bacterium]